MKPSLVQVSAPAVSGTVDFTDALISNDLKALITFGSEATANTTLTAQAKLFVGATDAVNNVAFSASALDAGAGSVSTASNSSNTVCYQRTSSAGTRTVAGVFQHANDGTISNGVRLNFPTVDAGTYLINGLMLAGADIEVKTSNVLFNTTDTTKTVTHNLTGTPQLVMAFVSYTQTAFDAVTVFNTSVGIWDGTNSVSTAVAQNFANAPTAVCARSNADFGHLIGVDTDFSTMSITSPGSTTFVVNRTSANSQAVAITFVSMRSLSGTFTAKAFQQLLPTATGNSALVTGMTGKPQVLITFPTRLQSTAFATDDTSGSFGMCVAVNNNGATQQMSVACTTKDNANPSVAKNQVFNNKALVTLDNTGATVHQATVNSWDSNGVTLNFSAVNATAVEVTGVAFGIFTSAGAGSNSNLLLGVG